MNSLDWDKLTPLMAAAGKGHLEMVQHLLREGADMALMDKDNCTVLMEVCMRVCVYECSVHRCT